LILPTSGAHIIPAKVTRNCKSSSKKMSRLLDILTPLTDVSLWALDEAGIYLESNNHYTWSPKGKPTVIERNGSHKGINIIGATEITKRFSFLYDTYPKGGQEDFRICAPQVIKFLERLRGYNQDLGIRKTFVILDNARIHTAKAVKAYAREMKDEMILIFLPPYSPELNPQENIWCWLKSFLAQAMAYADVSALLAGIDTFQSRCITAQAQVMRRVNARSYYK